MTAPPRHASAIELLIEAGPAMRLATGLPRRLACMALARAWQQTAGPGLRAILCTAPQQGDRDAGHV
ncbi:MAG TPA: hypothetical protein VJN44_19350 [Roseateles sp.]|nr:hypothetical protein [Roseateles sp.]